MNFRNLYSSIVQPIVQLQLLAVHHGCNLHVTCTLTTDQNVVDAAVYA